MRYAIFTDIHANLEALEAVLAKIDEIAKDKPIDQIWFLGDLVGYGPDPNECIRVLRERTDVIIAGNHDWAAVGKIDLEDFSAAARVSAEWTAEQLTQEYRDFLTDLPERLEIGDCTLVHGSPFGPLWEYLTSEALAERSFLYFDTRYCLVGHTHVPVIFIQPDSANIPTIPLDDDETTAHGYANGAGKHHEETSEEHAAAADDGTHAVGEADSPQTSGEMAEDETVELAMIQSQGQQSTLTAAARVESTASAYQELHGSESPAQFEAPASDLLQAQEQSDNGDSDHETAEVGSDSEPVEEHSDDDETVTEFSLARDETQEHQEPLDTTGNTGEDDDETVIASSHDMAIEDSNDEIASNDEAERQAISPDSIDGELRDDGNGDNNGDVVGRGTGEESNIDEVDEVDEVDGRTPENEIESAEERLTSEIEQLLNLLGLSQSMVQITNEMITPPEGHWETPPDHRAIINPGGVGQPRDGDPRAAFMIYDTERGFEFYRIPYDFEKTQEKIINAGLPQFLAVRLAYGR